jgi:hypothetical protein
MIVEREGKGVEKKRRGSDVQVYEMRGESSLNSFLQKSRFLMSEK